MNEAKKAIVQISSRGLLVWAGLFFFIAGWMFVLGILVGRGTAPVNLDADRLQKELAKLKAAMTAKQHAEIEAQAAGQKEGKPDFGFYEALKQAEPDKAFKVVGPGRTAPEKAPSQQAAGPKPPQPAQTQAREPQKAPAPVVEPPPADDSAKAPAPASTAASSAGRFTIQVAALKQASGANRLVDTLRKKGYPAYQIRSGADGEGVWYRVRVGAFKERAAAAGMLKKLQQERLKGLIVATQ